MFPEGTTVRVISKGGKRTFIVDKIILIDLGLLRYKIRTLNGTTTCTVAEKDLGHIHLELGDIPLKPSDVDNEVMTHCLSPEDIEKLRSDNMDISISDDEIITLYLPTDYNVCP